MQGRDEARGSCFPALDFVKDGAPRFAVCGKRWLTGRRFLLFKVHCAWALERNRADDGEAHSPLAGT